LHATAVSYNAVGQPISVTDALNQTTTFDYNSVGNLIATTDPLGNRTLRAYDAASRLITITDPRGKTTQFTYDALNRVTQIQDAINGLTTFTYDPNGNLLTVTDAKNQTTTYTYDNMDRLATRKDALNRTETHEYDLAGNLTKFTDRKGQVATFQYDALNRRIGATYADGTTTFTYDTVGRMTKAADTAPGAGIIDFAYDILNRLTQETTAQGIVNYQYDVLGRRTQRMANGQSPTMYQYDAASHLTRVAQGSLFAALGYDNANRRISLGYSNGTTTSYAYDVASRLTNITHNGPSGILEALTYMYDPAGNRSGVLRSNGTASLLPNPVASATYDVANEQTQFAGATLQYDANGNLTNDGVNTYQWDARNRVVGINGSVAASFVYDPLGRRSAKMINGVAVNFVYDRLNIAQETNGSSVTGTYLSHLGLDDVFFRSDSAGTSTFLQDALGSTVALSNATGASQTQYTYAPFGAVVQNGTATTNALKFTGREDDGTGLYYYRARYYHPRLQRFIAEDPLQFGGGDVNYYSYVGNNPLRFRDPYGLFAAPWHFIISFISMSSTGHCLGESVSTAWNDVITDFQKGSQSAANSNQHAMSVPGQSVNDAITGTLNMIHGQLRSGNLSGTLHTNEDRFAGGHGPDKEWDGFQLSDLLTPDFWSHQFQDFVPMPWDIINAIISDADLIQRNDSMSGRKPKGIGGCS